VERVPATRAEKAHEVVPVIETADHAIAVADHIEATESLCDGVAIVLLEFRRVRLDIPERRPRLRRVARLVDQGLQPGGVATEAGDDLLLRRHGLAQRAGRQRMSRRGYPPCARALRPRCGSVAIVHDSFGFTFDSNGSREGARLVVRRRTENVALRTFCAAATGA
jgi:hypothetical protein